MKAFRNRRVQRSYERVLLAVYGLADADGLYCIATNAEIAKAAGLAPETVKSYLHSLEHRGDIFILRPGDGVRVRTLVLLDNPASGRAIARVIVARRLELCGWPSR